VGVGLSFNALFQHSFEKFHLKTTVDFEQKKYVNVFIFTDQVGNIVGESKSTITNDYIILGQQVGISLW
jgi:hypothetical protein